eukprot:6658969-Prymnesium_polylepis.4
MVEHNLLLHQLALAAERAHHVLHGCLIQVVAQALRLMLRHRADAQAVVAPHLPRSCAQLAREETDECSLPCAVLADDGDSAAEPELQSEPAEQRPRLAPGPPWRASRWRVGLMAGSFGRAGTTGSSRRIVERHVVEGERRQLGGAAVAVGLGQMEAQRWVALELLHPL